ncbi:MAG: exonuclease domain-containing protein [Pseudomonadota bacterium]
MDATTIAIVALVAVFALALRRVIRKTTVRVTITSDPPPEQLHPEHMPRFQVSESVPDLPAGNFRFIALDVETANQHIGSICQIGLAFVGERNDIVVHSQLIDPLDDFDDFNIDIHGIEPEDVEGQPTFAEVFREMEPILKRNRVLQHSDFDRKAINAACENAGLDQPSIQWLDSVRIARRAWPELKGNGGHGLGNLKQVLDLDFEHHDAGEDARAAAMVVLRAEQHTGESFIDLAKRTQTSNYAPQVKMDGDATGPLFGQVAVFTGALKIERAEAARLAAEAGITTKASMSRKVTLLVVGGDDFETSGVVQRKSGKFKRAEELIAQGHDLRIISERKFLTLIERG